MIPNTRLGITVVDIFLHPFFGLLTGLLWFVGRHRHFLSPNSVGDFHQKLETIVVEQYRGGGKELY